MYPMNRIALSSPTARDNFNNQNENGSIVELSLNDFEDEDLSDILHEKELQLHSYSNDSFKVSKKSHHCHRHRSKTLGSNAKDPLHRSHSTGEAKNYSRTTPSRRPRPTSLRFFSEPARPAPLPTFWSSASITGVLPRKPEEIQHEKPVESNLSRDTTSRLKPTYSDETIKNNNTKIENEPQDTLSEKHKSVIATNKPRKNFNYQSKSEETKHRLQRSSYPGRLSTQCNLAAAGRWPSEPRRPPCMGLTRSASEWSIEDPGKTEYCYFNGEVKEQTHTALFKFVPRHKDEIQLEINDPIHVCDQADDFWYEGVNMRTGKKGIFPAYYAQSLLEDIDKMSDFSAKDDSCENFNIYFLGSVEVLSHKGNGILCQAMHKVAQARRETLHKLPPAYVCLTVSSSGIKMMDKSMLKRQSSNEQEKNMKLFSSSVQVKAHTHYFRLRNVSFCGHHSKNDKYFAFITRHPESSLRFACHVFVSETSTRPLAESVGRAFASFYREFMENTLPVEDIYIE